MDYLDHFSKDALDKGQQLYQDGLVEILAIQDNGIQAEVNDGLLYAVAATILDDDHVQMNCSCHHDFCEHQAAVYFKIKDSVQDVEATKIDYILEQLNDDQLASFVRKLILTSKDNLQFFEDYFHHEHDLYEIHQKIQLLQTFTPLDEENMLDYIQTIDDLANSFLDHLDEDPAVFLELIDHALLVVDDLSELSLDDEALLYYGGQKLCDVLASYLEHVDDERLEQSFHFLFNLSNVFDSHYADDFLVGYFHGERYYAHMMRYLNKKCLRFQNTELKAYWLTQKVTYLLKENQDPEDIQLAFSDDELTLDVIEPLVEYALAQDYSRALIPIIKRALQANLDRRVQRKMKTILNEIEKRIN